MAEMIVVKCDIGSKVAVVLCPSCVMISRQMLKAEFSRYTLNPDSYNRVV